MHENKTVILPQKEANFILVIPVFNYRTVRRVLNKYEYR